MTDHAPAAGIPATLFRLLLAAGVIVLPIWYAPGAHDVYRLPKLLLFRALGIAIAGLWIAFALVLPERTPRPRLSARELALLAVIAGWMVVTSLLSTDRLFSVDSMITTAAAMVIFLAAAAALPGQRPEWTMTIIAIPVMVNVVSIALQAMTTAPRLDRTGHPVRVGFHGFLGNANDAATFLAIPAIALLTYASVAGGKRRLLAASVSLMACGAIVITNTLASIVAVVAGIATLVLVSRHPRVLAAAVAIVAVVAAIAFTTYEPLRVRLAAARPLIAAHDYDRLLSGRLLAFATTVEMIRARPLVGVGPGCFELQYMDHQQAALVRHPGLKHSVTRGVNFGEAHNEPLQYAAELGIPGGLLFLLSLIAVALYTRSSNVFVRRLCLPLVVTVLVSSLAQFPFRLASPTMMCLYLAALCVSEPA